jgi:hypothetical protein
MAFYPAVPTLGNITPPLPVADGGTGLSAAPAGFTSFATGGAANLLNSSSGSSNSMVAGTIYYAGLWIPFNVTLTGLILVTATTGGTDSWIGALFSPSGATLASSALAGQTAQAANTKAKFPFTSPYNAIGPGYYIAGLQSNGTTAKYLGFSNAVEGFATGSVAGVFGTLTLGTPATSYNINIGPFITTY